MIPLVLLVLGGIATALVTQWDRLPFDSAQSTGGPSDLSRFKGLDGMTVQPADVSMYWWLRTTVEETVTSEDLPEEFTVENADDLIQRTVLPSGITFRADSAELSPEALEGIRTAASSLPKNFIRITVLCHSSADGTKESRLPLSQERAEVLAGELESILGVTAGSIVRMGLGDQYPVAGIDPESPTGRLVNRRCEILVES
ncbi:MAG: OmpA family protein [Ilumatobacteraceae bacterium]